MRRRDSGSSWSARTKRKNSTCEPDGSAQRSAREFRSQPSDQPSDAFADRFLLQRTERNPEAAADRNTHRLSRNHGDAVSANDAFGNRHRIRVRVAPQETVE